jgi:hypothetical protein
MALGKWREAREAYEKALRLGHENPGQLESKIEKSRRKANNKEAR